MRFGKQNRVRLTRDFEFVKSNSMKADCSAFIFYARPDPERKYSRIAIVASKRVGCAVERNTARRRFRAIFRECSQDFPVSGDILIFVRSCFRKFEYADLKNKFRNAAQKLLSENKNSENGK